MANRGRPRRAGADEEILRAARELLEQGGYGAFNVDIVAERSRVAKTTIYRRWATKGALAAAAMENTPTATEPEAILEETASLLSILTSPDADAIDVMRAVLTPRRERLRAALAPRPDAHDLADMLLGALLTRLILEDKPAIPSIPF
ncbi:MAG TPA: helix-turn-helix domain-containing protein [Thermoanaerobaculia bacterium]|nr:helix-turn-helix domain-containing protein [Thermoanaerobaculia bacterium]